MDALADVAGARNRINGRPIPCSGCILFRIVPPDIFGYFSVSTRSTFLGAVGAAATLVVGSALAESPVPLSDTSLVRGAFGQTVVPASSFGIPLYSIAQDTEPSTGGARDTSTVRVIGEYDQFSESGKAKPSSFGIAWQHRLSARDQLSVSAEHADSLRYTGYADAGDTRAAVAFTREFDAAWRPSFTGSVFLGDESARTEEARAIGRKYMGFTVGGQLNVFRSHSPYVAFQMRRSYYEGNGAGDALLAGGVARAEDQSRLSAGWRWQVQPQMSLEAGASLGLGLGFTDTTVNEGNRVYFGTRFDFR